jgi:cholesterol oxidase
MSHTTFDYDYVIIGSGFGGSVSALRLAEKGYKVLVIEKGKWFAHEADFPKTNWNLRKWMWLPSLGLQGMLKLSIYKHVTVLSGVGVGGGSIVYANTLPIPKQAFFKTGSWQHLADWEQELKPFYQTALKMLGASQHPYMSRSDESMKQLAVELGKPEAFERPDVAVYFGKSEETVADPYFDGKGPDRTGCKQCGGCMLGCRYNAKNTLDKNYLHLAQQLGCEIKAETEVYDVIPLNEDGSAGYEIKFKDALRYFGKKGSITTRSVLFAGGVLGTLPLLLKLKKTSLPRLSDQLGRGVRTNSESLIGVTTFDDVSYAEGIAIGSIVHIDENRHVEPVKYSEGSGFWRILMAPMVQGKTVLGRIFNMFKEVIIHPRANLKAFFVDDWSKRTQILLYMESIDSTLRMKRRTWGGLKTALDQGAAPTAFNPIAQSIAKKIEKINNGKAMVLANETLLGSPTTAHILGGACMGSDATQGVIDADNRVFNYHNMLICDGSAISANPGVNPSLSITAITERAMSKIGHSSHSVS